MRHDPAGRNALVRRAALCALVLALPTSLRADDDGVADRPAAPPAASAASAPATQPETPGAAERRATFLLGQRQMLSEMLAEHPRLPARRPDEVLTLALVDGHLSFAAGADVPDEASLPLPEGRGAISFRRIRAGPPGGPEVEIVTAKYLRLHGDEAKSPAATYVELSTSPINVQLTLNEQTPDATTDAQLLDKPRALGEEDSDPPNARLLFQRRAEIDENEPGAEEEREGRVQHIAPTFAALIDQHHDDVVSAMLEAFTSLRATHVLSGLTEQQVRQVLATDAPPAPEAERQVAAVLDALKKSGGDAVEPVRQQLAKDGMAVAIALARADRRGWSADLSQLVDTVLADALPLSQRAARRVLASPTRLVDALYWPDPAVRRAIKARLASIVGDARVAGIDPAADPYAQVGTIESLRAALLKPAAP